MWHTCVSLSLSNILSFTPCILKYKPKAFVIYNEILILKEHFTFPNENPSVSIGGIVHIFQIPKIYFWSLTHKYTCRIPSKVPNKEKGGISKENEHYSNKDKISKRIWAEVLFSFSLFDSFLMFLFVTIKMFFTLF